MKIIFLDIDGVLNCESDMGTKYDARLNTPCHFYSTRCRDNLNTLLEQTEANIVVSSTWRLGETIESMQDILIQMGVIGEVIGLTPRLHGEASLRGNEILKWIKDNQDHIGVPYYQYRTYVILDDDSDMLYWQKDNFVCTDRYSGLTIKDCNKAMMMLNYNLNINKEVWD